MRLRIVTLNIEQDHKRWGARRSLIIEEIGRLQPDLMALNEVSVPLQTAPRFVPGRIRADRRRLPSGAADTHERAVAGRRARRC